MSSLIGSAFLGQDSPDAKTGQPSPSRERAVSLSLERKLHPTASAASFSKRRAFVVGSLAALLVWTASAVTAQQAVLRVGTSGDYPPFSHGEGGFDRDVAALLAQDFDLHLEWVSFRWPELQTAVRQKSFDVAMSGVTWRPHRAVDGWMSRAVAVGGPCVVGHPSPRRVAVNRGGVLEAWTRKRFPDRELRAVDDNLSLPRLLASRQVDAFVTDSFEVKHFHRDGSAVRCETPRDAKVYWVSPRRAAELGPRLDQWLARREPQIDDLRRRHFGDAAPRDEVDHLLDLLRRRLSFMPLVVAWKRENNVAIEDPAREAEVLARATSQARGLGVEPAGLRAFFRLQIELAKAVQRRSPPGQTSLDLRRQVRPTLSRLGERITRSLAVALPLDPAQLSPQRLALLDDLLTRAEIEGLRTALLQLRLAPRQTP